MMRHLVALLGLLGLGLPAAAQTPSSQGPPASSAREEWSYVFTPTDVWKAPNSTLKSLRLPEGLHLCNREGEPTKDSDGKPAQDVRVARSLSLSEEVQLDQRIQVSSDAGCKAGSLQDIMIKTARPVLRPADLDLAHAVLDADAPTGQVRLLVTPRKPVADLPASLVKSTRLKVKLGPFADAGSSEQGVCVGSEPVCTQIAFSVDQDGQGVHSVTVLETLGASAQDDSAGGRNKEFLASTGAPFNAAELQSTAASVVSLWQFDQLEIDTSHIASEENIPYVTVPWAARPSGSLSSVSVESEPLLRLLGVSDGGDKSLKCVETGKPLKEARVCATLNANTLTLTQKPEAARLKPGGAGLLLIGRLPEGVSVRQRQTGLPYANEVAIRIQPVECSYSFKQLTVATAGFHSVEVLYQVKGVGHPKCPLPAIAQVATDSGIHVQRQPKRWHPAGRGMQDKMSRTMILSLVLEEVKGDPKTHPLTFKLDADTEITPRTPASLQVDAAPHFSDPLRVFVQSPFVGSSYAKSSSASSQPVPKLLSASEIQMRIERASKTVRASGGQARGSPQPPAAPAATDPAEPAPTAAPKPAPLPGIVLVDAIATNRDTFFEFGTGKQQGWHLQIRSKGQRPCLSDQSKTKGMGNKPDEMTFFPDLGVAGAFCLVGMQDANKLDLRVVRRGGAGTAHDRELALDAAAVELLDKQGVADATIDGGWADFTVALTTKPFRLALNLARYLSFRCVDPELVDKAPNAHIPNACIDEEDSTGTHPALASGAAVYAYSYDALKHCALRIDIPKVSMDSERKDATVWERIQKELRELDLQRLQISLGLAKTDKDTFQAQALNDVSILVLDPTRPQPPDWSEQQPERRLCKPIDLTQGDRINVEPYARVQVVIEHQDKGLYRGDLDFSTPSSRFEVIVRRKPMYGVGASKYSQHFPNPKGKPFFKERVLDWRMYLSIPLSLTLLRGPNSGSASKVSSDIDVPEVAGFGVGAIGIFEPWNYHQNRPIWGSLGPQFHIGLLTTLPYNALQDTKNLVYPSVSLVAGVGLRLPPSVSPSGSGGGVEAALNAIVWGELMVVSSAPQWRENYRPIPAILFGLIGQFGAVGN